MPSKNGLARRWDGLVIAVESGVYSRAGSVPRSAGCRLSERPPTLTQPTATRSSINPRGSGGAPWPLEAPRSAQGRWCYVEGTHISLFCWVEQVAEDGVLFSRLHQRGEAVGRSLDLVHIYLGSEGPVIGVSPHFLLLLPDESAPKDGDGAHVTAQAHR